MSSDVSWHIRDKLWPMLKHGSIILYVHGNQNACWDRQPRTATSTLTQLLKWLISKSQYCQVHFEQVSNMVTWSFSAWWLISEGRCCWVHFEQASYYFWRQDCLQQVVWNKTVQGLTKVEVVYLVFTQVPDIPPGLSCCVPFIHMVFIKWYGPSLFIELTVSRMPVKPLQILVVW